MVLPKPKPKIPSRTLGEIKQQGVVNLSSRFSYATSSLWASIYRLIPLPLLYLLPFIKEDIQDLFKPETEKEKAEDESPIAVDEPTFSGEFPVGSEPIYEKYRCPFGNPLYCQQPQQTIEQDPQAKSCQQCLFPALLSSQAEIQGNRGRYRITRFLGSRGFGRLYAAVHLVEDEPAIVKEYLLPQRHFNQQEAIKTQKTFESVGGLQLADGRVQNGRIVGVMEAIADRNDPERCYLITKGEVDSYATLRTYLAKNGAMSSQQVRHLLNQVLQSLEYLHGSKFRLPNGQIQAGIIHGNLSLDSLLISPQPQIFFHNPQFFVYLCDLNLWENLFDPPPSPNFIITVTKELEALGYISFYLLAGRSHDDSGRLLDPKLNRHWNRVDVALKFYIFRLLGLDNPFASAKEARQALLNLPTEEELIAAGLQPTQAAAPTSVVKRQRKWLWWLLMLLGLALLGSAIGWWLLKQQTALAKNEDLTICCISEVPAVPDGKFNYTAEKNGIWNYILKQPNLIEKDKMLEVELAQRLPQIQLNYLPQLTGAEAIAKVRQEEADFAITSLIDNNSDDLKSETFAYDGLVVFVAFSYEQRDRALPHFLKGQITLQQLRQLYTGKITNWQQLGGPNLPVKLYIPTSEEAIRIFEQRVLKYEDAIAEFRNLQTSQTNSASFTKATTEIVQLPTLITMRTVLKEFENDRVGAIGFGALSQVFGQCSVYPLALVDNNNRSIQPLIQDTGKPIDPSTDLCNKKGGYYPDLQAFQTGSYPLAYPIAVVYPLDNRRPPIGERFANILKTQESQRLLTKTGVVPLKPPQ